MRVVALNKPILFLYDHPDVGDLPLKIRKITGEEDTTISYHATAQCYLKELTFTVSGSCLVILNDGVSQISEHVVAGNPDGVFFYAAMNYQTGLTIPWSLYRVGINNVSASGNMLEIREGFYQLQLPNNLTENSYVLTISDPQGMVEKRPLAWRRELGAFQVLYVDNISMPCGSTAGGCPNLCEVIRI